jgi:hypothetical protein
MPPFPKPAFDYDYELDAQIAALRAYEQIKSGRAIPPKQSDRVLRRRFAPVEVLAASSALSDPFGDAVPTARRLR